MVRLSPKGILVAAVVCSLLTAILIYMALQEDAVPAASATRTVVVAARNIEGRAKIAESDLKTAEVPEELVKQGAMTELKSVIGTRTKSPIAAGDQIQQMHLVLAPGEGSLAGSIPPDKRAMTIAIDDVSGVAGFVRPGDYVDIIASVQSGERGNVTSQVILQDIQVLAVGKIDVIAADSTDSVGKASGGAPTATLAVTLDEAARLHLFKGAGALTLALRPFNVKGRQIALGRNLADVMGYGVLRGKAAAPPAASPPPAPQPVSRPRPAVSEPPPARAPVTEPSGGITVYRGADKEIVRPVK